MVVPGDEHFNAGVDVLKSSGDAVDGRRLERDGPTVFNAEMNSEPLSCYKVKDWCHRPSLLQRARTLTGKKASSLVTALKPKDGIPALSTSRIIDVSLKLPVLSTLGDVDAPFKSFSWKYSTNA